MGNALRNFVTRDDLCHLKMGVLQPPSAIYELVGGIQLNKVKLIDELNEREAHSAVVPKVSWHSMYKDSAWIFLEGHLYELTEEGSLDVSCQEGEIVNTDYMWDKTGKFK